MTSCLHAVPRRCSDTSTLIGWQCCGGKPKQMVWVFVDSIAFWSDSACLVHCSTCASMRADLSLSWTFSLVPSVSGQRGRESNMGMCV